MQRTEEEISADRIGKIQGLARTVKCIDHENMKQITDWQDILARVNGNEIRDAVQGLNKDDRGRLFWILANVESFDIFMEYLKHGIYNPWKNETAEKIYAQADEEYKGIADRLASRGEELNKKETDLRAREIALEQKERDIEHEAAVFQTRIMQNNGQEIRNLRYQLQDLTYKLGQERTGNRKGRMMLRIARGNY